MDRWNAENQRLKLAYHASAGKADREEIRLAAGCTFADAWRLAALREAGSGLLIQRWLAGKLTWARLWRIVSAHPCDPDAQLREAQVR